MASLLDRAYDTYRRAGLRPLLIESAWYVSRHPRMVRLRAAVRTAIYRRYQGYEAIADPFETIAVDPYAITHANLAIDKYTDVGAIRGGDWDRDTEPYEESPKYRAVRRRFEEGRPWEETDIYRRLLERLDEEGYVDGCYSRADLGRRYERIDALYESIRTHGYDPERRFDDGTRVDSTLDQICVSIGRDGELIFCGGGNHRFSIARILDVETVPVRVVVRHERWQRRREEVANRSTTPSFDGDLHPDLRDLSYYDATTSP